MVTCVLILYILVMNFKTVVNKIISESEYDEECIADLQPATEVNSETQNTTLIIEGGVAIMDLHITREAETEVTVGHYVDGNARNPDPVVHFDYPEFDPKYMKQSYSTTKDTAKINKFINETWKHNLRNQFIHSENDK